MIEGLLEQNQSGLYCTYGVTNSGKSYTVHGGKGAGESGVLPRTLDTIFNSLDGLLSDSEIRPVGVSGVEELDRADAALLQNANEGMDTFDPLSLNSLRKRLLSADCSKQAEGGLQYEREEATVKVDRNYRYSVWLSYLEVYNEKLYDLLDVAMPAGGAPAVSGGMSRSESFRNSNWTLSSAARGKAGAPGESSLLSSASTTFLSRHALQLKNDAESAGDPEGQCKYATGLSEHRVRSAEEARALIKCGEQNRAVFGTMANRVSSRSHGVFTVRIIREHAGEADGTGDGKMYSTSRMSIVDLAGSERMANTQLTDAARMKEAVNINKSLMNLGHCLEKLKANQTKAQALMPSGKSAFGAVNLPAKPEVVPFNSSKLTALLKTYFVGEGNTVMIITANPYDGGFYENAHVMKFSAVARNVQSFKNAPNARRAAMPRSPTKVSLQQLAGVAQAQALRDKAAANASHNPSPPRQLVFDGDSNEDDITIIEGECWPD